MRRKTIRKLVTYFFLVVFTLIILFPFSWLIFSSFKRDRQTFTATPQPFWWTDPFWANFYMLTLGKVPLGWGGEEVPGSRALRVPMYAEMFVAALRNTLYTSIVSALLCVILGSVSAYAFVTTRFPGSKRLFIGYFATRTIPITVLLIPLFILFRTLQLLDRPEAIIIVSTALLLPYATWILKEYFTNIPMDLYDSARVDGCSKLRVLWKIFLPVSAPGLIAAGIFCFMAVWNSFLIPLILSRSLNSMMMSVYVSNFITDIDIDIGFMNASGVLATIPSIIIALLFQKYIIQGIMQGAIKG